MTAPPQADAGARPAALAEPEVGNYFVAAYPPFSAWSAEQIPALEAALGVPHLGEPLGTYVHVPFCAKKCDFCYYLSYVGQDAAVVDRYLDAVIGEAALCARRTAVRERPMAFVYFGGGTPSMLGASQVRRLGLGLRGVLPWDASTEVTYECAPRSVRPDLIPALQEIGVTRVSMGVQSFDDRVLRWNGRVHLAADILRAYALIREAGFPWVNLDLMAGMLGETDATWAETVRHVLELAPDSVTIYQTEVPHNTRLFAEHRGKTLPMPLASWPVKRRRLDYAFAQLDRAGYTIVSGYNAVRQPERHRFRYQEQLWGGGDMLGLGVASFGYLGGVHYQNQTSLEAYMESVATGTLPVKRAYALSEEERMTRAFILQLKTGIVDRGLFATRHGKDPVEVFATPVRALEAEGFLRVTPGQVRMTEEGLLRVDRLLPLFYERRFQMARYT